MKRRFNMKKKLLTSLFAAAFIFGFLFPGSQPQNPNFGGVSTCSILGDVYTNF